MADLDIAAFLRARLDEREAKANGALSGPWTVEEHTYETVVTVDGGQVVATVEGLRDGWHIADNDPQFVLDDVAAKRQILAMHERDVYSWGGVNRGYCRKCAVGDSCDECLDYETQVWPCETLRLLALPYVGHPEFREEWKP